MIDGLAARADRNLAAMRADRDHEWWLLLLDTLLETRPRAGMLTAR